MFVFRKIWRALLSCYLSFEIRPFALLPAKSLTESTSILTCLDFDISAYVYMSDI